MNWMKYDGTFELAFLRDDEMVRSRGKGDASIEILRGPEQTVVAEVLVGDYLKRHNDGGISVLTPLGLHTEAEAPDTRAEAL